MTISAPLPARPPALRKRALLIGCAIGGLCLGAGEAARAGLQRHAEDRRRHRRLRPRDARRRDDPGRHRHGDHQLGPVRGTDIFLPAGNIATFTNGPNNPISSSSTGSSAITPIRFDGTVLSLIQNAALGIDAAPAAP